VLLHPEPAGRTGAAGSLLFPGFTYKISAVDRRSYFLTGGTVATSGGVFRYGTIQNLRKQQCQGAFADSLRSGEDHRVRHAILRDRTGNYFYNPMVAYEIFKQDGIGHIALPGDIQDSSSGTILENTSSGEPFAGIM
jgi:hypothetical protein